MENFLTLGRIRHIFVSMQFFEVLCKITFSIAASVVFDQFACKCLSDWVSKPVTLYIYKVTNSSRLQNAYGHS